jgi:hypothetical protein
MTIPDEQHQASELGTPLGHHNCHEYCPAYPDDRAVRGYLTDALGDDAIRITPGARTVFIWLAWNTMYADRSDRGQVLDRLQSQRKLAAELGLSRRAVQYALEALADQHLITYDPAPSDGYHGRPKTISMGPWYEELVKSWRIFHGSEVAEDPRRNSCATLSADLAPSTTEGTKERTHHEDETGTPSGTSTSPEPSAPAQPAAEAVDEEMMTPESFASDVADYFEHEGWEAVDAHLLARRFTNEGVSMELVSEAVIWWANCGQGPYNQNEKQFREPAWVKSPGRYLHSTLSDIIAAYLKSSSSKAKQLGVNPRDFDLVGWLREHRSEWELVEAA